MAPERFWAGRHAQNGGASVEHITAHATSDTLSRPTAAAMRRLSAIAMLCRGGYGSSDSNLRVSFQAGHGAKLTPRPGDRGHLAL